MDYLIDGKIKNGIVMKEKGIFGVSAWPSVARLSDGSLAAVASSGRLAHICPFGKVKISLSFDDGISWEKSKTIIDTPLDDRDAGICVRGKQVLVTTFNNSIEFQKQSLESLSHTKADRKRILQKLKETDNDAEEKFLGSLIAVSNDDGRTFESPYKVPISSPHGPILIDNKYFYVGRYFKKNNSVEDKDDGIFYIFSEDGYTWTESVKIGTPPDGLYCEPHAIAVEDGILVAFRLQDEKGKFTIALCNIDKNGKQSSIRQTGIDGSPPHLMRHSSGVIILSFARRKEPFGQRVRISCDEGQTWSDDLIIRSDGYDWDLGYPATSERKDGSLITIYYQKHKKTTSDILYSIWKFKEHKRTEYQ